MDLYHRSINVILENQDKSGAYIASPSFENYRFTWLRDSSFIAHAMDRVGEFKSADAYFHWVDRVISRHAWKVDRLEEQLKAAPTAKDLSYLHTRYTVEGEEDSADSGWGNFQIDGYGTWLWALAEHIEITGNVKLINEFSLSIITTIRYLRAAWLLPNYDCWEEHPEYLHPYSIAAIYGGLNAIARVLEKAPGKAEGHAAAELAREVKKFLLDSCVSEGKFVKHVFPATKTSAAHPVVRSGVDASLLGLATPYQVLPLADPLIEKTLDTIESELLRPGGGVYRYSEDVYYGGGEWILLTAWLGCTYVQAGRTRDAENLLAWIEQCTDGEGNLPEQVNDHVLFPDQFKPWVEKWGKVASPLLWSHAMYLILYEEVRRK